MIRNLTATLVLVGALGACKIERTPQQYFDHREPRVGQQDAIEGEIEDRVRAAGLAIARGNSTDAMAALAPADEIHVLGPIQGTDVTGTAAVEGLIELLAGMPAGIEMRDVQVEVGPRFSVAWFRTSLQVDPVETGPAPPTVRMSGVYVVREGSWRLVQLHLSFAGSDLSSLEPYRGGAAPPPGGE